MYIRATINANRLKLSADNATRAELAALLHAHGYQRAEMFVGECLHERWEFIAPEHIGALTDAPILCDDVERTDDGDVIARGRVAWFPDYCVRCPWSELARTGRVVFVIAADESAKAAA